MSRRPLGPGSQPRPQSRMAPGGRLWSESPVRRPYPRVRQMGSEEEAPPGGPSLLWEFDGDLSNSGWFGEYGDFIDGTGPMYAGSCLKLLNNLDGPYTGSVRTSMRDLPLTFADLIHAELDFTTVPPEETVEPYQHDSYILVSVMVRNLGTPGTVLQAPLTMNLPSQVDNPGSVGAFASFNVHDPDGVPGSTPVDWWDSAVHRSYHLVFDSDTTTGEVACTSGGETTVHPSTALNTGPIVLNPGDYIDVSVTADNVHLCRLSIEGIIPASTARGGPLWRS